MQYTHTCIHTWCRKLFDNIECWGTNDEISSTIKISAHHRTAIIHTLTTSRVRTAHIHFISVIIYIYIHIIHSLIHQYKNLSKNNNNPFSNQNKLYSRARWNNNNTHFRSVWTISISVSLSRVPVASSSNKHGGSLIRALASAMRACWPPERSLPATPTYTHKKMMRWDNIKKYKISRGEEMKGQELIDRSIKQTMEYYVNQHKLDIPK